MTYKKNMNELISVIIPVYKVESYLIDCIESVLAQTYRNIEIILVDDGSPDRCPQICDAYASKDARIRVLHKENGGLSSARNAGLDIAKGEFIAFLDSDDLWSPVFLERLYRAITQTDASFSVCLFQRFSDTVPNTPNIAETECLTQQAAFECLFSARNENIVVAPNKLYRKDLFKSLRYPLDRLHEDEAVIHQIIGSSKKVAWIEEAHYFYRVTPNSITTTKFNLKRLDETKAKEERILWFESHGMHDLADKTRIVYMNNLMRLYRTVQENTNPPLKKLTCENLHGRFLELYALKLIPDKNFKFRFCCFLFRHFPGSYSRIVHHWLRRKELT